MLLRRIISICQCSSDTQRSNQRRDPNYTQQMETICHSEELDMVRMSHQKNEFKLKRVQDMCPGLEGYHQKAFNQALERTAPNLKLFVPEKHPTRWANQNIPDDMMSTTSIKSTAAEGAYFYQSGIGGGTAGGGWESASSLCSCVSKDAFEIGFRWRCFFSSR